ncbi:M12 family metallopeptidase [Priestia megaterium]|uniref:M12 family metallopeptidase n=1 Tax=Priestia megaterium TaxID=1404 RepID=UPI00077D9224|nr:M12 family metallopeptidase [Priestia megaterium]
MGYAIADSKYRWPNGRIPYEIDPHLLSNTYAATEVRKAIEHWNDNTIIQLFRRENNEADYLYFTLDLVDCESYVGRQGKKQTILCALTSKNFDKGNVIHEIGHAVGLYHEHTRLDRNKYVKIEFENIKNDKHRDFDYPKDDRGRLIPTIDFDKYDFSSVMHYKAKNGSVAIDPKNDTITCITGACPIDMGQRVGLSPTDIRTVEAIYSLDFESLGGLAWGGDIAMTALGDSLYAVQNKELYKARPTDGEPTPLINPEEWGEWGGTTAMTALGDSLYVIQSEQLYKVRPTDGKPTPLNRPAWGGDIAMTALGDSLYVIQNKELYKVRPTDGEWTPLINPEEWGEWGGTTAMTALGDSLYVIQNKELYKVRPTDGKPTPLINPEEWGEWGGTTAMTALGDSLYVIQSEQLYKVRPTDGKPTPLGSQMWRNPPHAIAGIGRHLYIIDNGHLFKVSP